MKKILFIVLAVCAMIATVAAAPMPASVTLVGVSNGGGGPMFTFRVDGPVNLNNGVVHSVDGQYKGDFPLSCVQKDATTVVCHAPKKLSGSNVTVEFGGTRSWVQIPESQAPAQSSYCYGYYKLTEDSSLPFGPMKSASWSEVANICQDTPATDGDKKTYSGDPYQFIQDGLNDSHNYNPGPAYYMNAN